MAVKSILIKDTTKQEREQIVAEALGFDNYSQCSGEGGFGIDYDQYVEGKKELKQLNEEYKANIVMAGRRDDEKRSSCAMN